MDKTGQVLKALEVEARNISAPYIGPEKAKILEGVIFERKPKRILEIGTLHGYSAIVMGRLLPEGGKLITIEANEESAAIARENVRKAGLEARIEVIYGDAFDVLPDLGGKFDMLFIDAAKVEYLRYLQAAEKKLAPDSVVVADNVGIFEEHMKDYLDYVRNSGNFNSLTLKVSLEQHQDVQDAMEVSVKL